MTNVEVMELLQAPSNLRNLVRPSIGTGVLTDRRGSNEKAY